MSDERDDISPIQIQLSKQEDEFASFDVLVKLLAAAEDELPATRFVAARVLLEQLRRVLNGEGSEELVEIETLLAKIQALLEVSNTISPEHLAVARTLIGLVIRVLVNGELSPDGYRPRRVLNPDQSQVERRTVFEQQVHAALDLCRVNGMVDPARLTILLLNDERSSFDYPLGSGVLGRLCFIRDKLGENPDAVWQLPTKFKNINILLKAGISTLTVLRECLRAGKNTWRLSGIPLSNLGQIDVALDQIEAALAQISQE